MKDPNHAQNVSPAPVSRSFLARSISDVSHFDGLAFGTRIASWYGEERTLARARPCEV
jgi:hypothetical protein